MLNEKLTGTNYNSFNGNLQKALGVWTRITITRDIRDDHSIEHEAQFHLLRKEFINREAAGCRLRNHSHELR